MSAVRRRPSGRRFPLLPGLLLLAIVAAVGVGAWLQFGERQAQDTVHTAGRADPPWTCRWP